MTYILGIITGVLLAIFLGIIFLCFKQPLERKIRQVESKLKIKGNILEPENNELEQWKEEIKE